jgi:hypoxanthine phosphoribosyltransferase
MKTPTKADPTKVFLPWEKVEEACAALAARLPKFITGVAPVGRGGCVPAAIIAYELQLPIVGLILPEGEVVSALRNLVIVDDICDTGQTFAKIRPRFKYAMLVAPYVKPQGKSVCDYWVEEYTHQHWLVMPWAKDDVVNR